ncbi:hypothetical protein TUM19329_01960 [Legionella antarctica]|uniref:Solute-binding protein family 3/N-terminal domain-containing protein n=1 Tax=Legionella antarctica TaxID=2708020 RepID=A0A6F8SZK8_9GAMM|nr:transporter substrate-binding domain-containing protein [Legionella antarctica]BCA93835.1 hypothetical protein TUM19329_01960 [Legionella antarctica]
MKGLVFIILFISHIFVYGNALKIGVLQFAPPFSSVAGDGNHYYGFTIDLMDNICQRMQLECNYVSTTIDQHVNSLLQGIIDVSFIPVPIPAKLSGPFIFSLPYLTSNGQFLATKESSINSLAEIKNQKIGVISGTLYDVIIESHYGADNDIIKYEKITDLISALANQEVNLIYVNASVARYMRCQPRKRGTSEAGSPW